MGSVGDPSVGALFLFSLEALRSSEAEPVCQPWASNPGLALEMVSDEPGRRRYTGHMPDGIRCQLDWNLAQDTHLLRVTLCQPGDHPPSAWARLRGTLNELTLQAYAKPLTSPPWAATFLVHGILPTGTLPAEASALLADPAAPAMDPARAGAADPTPYGWLWVLRQGWHPEADAPGARWQRELALLSPHDRAEPARTYFLEPLSQGLARIELYLHKGAHHARQHEAVRAALEGATTALQGEMMVALRTADWSQLHREQAELEKIAQKLMRFQAQRAQTEVLLNSLRNNLRALEEHLARVKLEAPHYAQQVAHLARQAEQLESDVRNAHVVSESTYVFQDIQRGVETTRLERASFLMGGAAALLAAVAIFNSFVDIWNLVVQGSQLILPEPWLRAVLGAVAAVAWPLGAYWAIEHRRRRAAVALAIGFLALILAVVTTVLVNR